MNRLVFFFFLLIFCNTIYSQNEITRDSLKIRLSPQENTRGEAIIYRESLNNSLDMELPDIQTKDEAESKLPNTLCKRLILTPNLLSRSLSSTFSYSLKEYDFNYGIGNYRQGGIKLFYKPTDRLSLSMGGDVVNYNILHSRYNDILYDFNSTYEITNRFFLSLFGQYSVNSLRNANSGGYMFSPQTSYGATFRFKASEKIDFNIGIERSFNSMTNQWESTGIMAPSIRLR